MSKRRRDQAEVERVERADRADEAAAKRAASTARANKPNLRVRLADGKEVQISRRDLQRALLSGGVGQAADIWSDEDGAWRPVRTWLTLGSRIDAGRDESGERYMAEHVVDVIEQHAVLRLLGLDRSLGPQMEAAIRRAAVAKIEMPAWGLGQQFDCTTEITMPAWANSVVLDADRAIEVPAWGRGFKLPEPCALIVPEWVDPTEALTPSAPRKHHVARPKRRKPRPSGARVRSRD